jgi:archaellum biogenesis ATPase FlaH
MKTVPFGLSFLDEEYNGVYAGRGVLLTGASGSGKTLLGLQFLKGGLAYGEAGMILSVMPVRDLAICGQVVGIDVDRASRDDQLFLLEYEDYVPGRDHEENVLVPHGGFEELQQLIKTYHLKRVVLDTLLPWIGLSSPERLAEDMFSLIRSFERQGVTALFTLPCPKSAAAGRLKGMLQAMMPVSMSVSARDNRRCCTVDKYLGQAAGISSGRLSLKNGLGLVEENRYKVSENIAAPSEKADGELELNSPQVPLPEFAL